MTIKHISGETQEMCERCKHINLLIIPDQRSGEGLGYYQDKTRRYRCMHQENEDDKPISELNGDLQCPLYETK